jgi:hypothetical protein
MIDKISDSLNDLPHQQTSQDDRLDNWKKLMHNTFKDFLETRSKDSSMRLDALRRQAPPLQRLAEGQMQGSWKTIVLALTVAELEATRVAPHKKSDWDQGGHWAQMMSTWKEQTDVLEVHGGNVLIKSQDGQPILVYCEAGLSEEEANALLLSLEEWVTPHMDRWIPDEFVDLYTDQADESGVFDLTYDRKNKTLSSDFLQGTSHHSACQFVSELDEVVSKMADIYATHMPTDHESHMTLVNEMMRQSACYRGTFGTWRSPFKGVEVARRAGLLPSLRAQTSRGLLAMVNVSSGQDPGTHLVVGSNHRQYKFPWTNKALVILRGDLLRHATTTPEDGFEDAYFTLVFPPADNNA